MGGGGGGGAAEARARLRGNLRAAQQMPGGGSGAAVTEDGRLLAAMGRPIAAMVEPHATYTAMLRAGGPTAHVELDAAAASP